MEFIVSCINRGSRFAYCVNLGERITIKKVDITCSPGEVIEIDDYSKPVPEGSRREFSDKALRLPAIETPIKIGITDADEITKRMWPKIEAAAMLIARKVLLSIPVIIRFHNDADGSSGAVALHRALRAMLESKMSTERLNIRWIMNKGVSYGTSEAAADKLWISNYDCIEKPLMIFIDFGTSVDSNQGVAYMGDSTEIVWLDHHPIEDGFCGKGLEHYINPWLFGGDSSYTAGLLSCILSKAISNLDTSIMEDASLIGDHSRYARFSDDGVAISTILDMITSDPEIVKTSNQITPAEIERILESKKRREELLHYARIRSEEAMAAASKSLRKHQLPGAKAFISDFKKVRKDGTKYPLPGRFASMLFDRLSASEQEPCILMLHFGSYISIRMDARLNAKVGMRSLIAEEKRRHEEVISSGGGHDLALSIKLKDESDKEMIIRDILMLVTERLGKGKDANDQNT